MGRQFPFQDRLPTEPQFGFQQAPPGYYGQNSSENGYSNRRGQNRPSSNGGDYYFSGSQKKDFDIKDL